ncbi:MAG: DNA-binding domain-containing protein [Burkholderiaceae bacterium]
MSAEAARQQALVQALLNGAAVSGLRPLAGIEGGVRRGLDAYRLNARALAGRALASSYPQVREWLGEADFAAMAWAFWRRHPPLGGDLAAWGAELADFLDAQHGMEPALSDRARLDWARHLCERAADARQDAASLNRLADSDPARLRLILMPGLQLLSLQAGPHLVWRREWRAFDRPLTAGESLFFDALLQRVDLNQALQRVLALDGPFDFGAWLQAALREGWLQAVEELIADQETP